MRNGDVQMNHHLVRNRVEDAKFLLETGESLGRIAQRLNVPIETLKKELERERNRSR